MGKFIKFKLYKSKNNMYNFLYNKMRLNSRSKSINNIGRVVGENLITKRDKLVPLSPQIYKVAQTKTNNHLCDKKSLSSFMSTQSDSFTYNKSSIFDSKILDYGPYIQKEIVFENKNTTIDKVQYILKNEICTIIGYGPQGQAQALNLKDSGINVNIGVRENGNSWNNAIKDGFIPGINLFSIENAVDKGTIIMFLLSDAGQIDIYPKIKDKLNNKTLYFSHGFGIVFSNLTGIKIENNSTTDIIMVAPKGSGKSVRNLYKIGKGINSSYAIYKDYSGKAKEKALAIGFGIGSPYIYETTFENEVMSDLTGERSILMGGIAGLFKAQYDVLRENGHSPSEAYNETVEEALQSLYPLINENGMDYMFSNCSTTAQRGALDWSKRFELLNKPLIKEIYKNVQNGNEAKITINSNSSKYYKKKLNKELNNINNMEIWQVGKEIRKLRK